MSKFRTVLDEAKGRATEPAKPPPATPPPSPAPAETKPKKPKGRRSDPAFVQVTAYIPDALNRDVEMALLASGRKRQFSVLVTELLTTWLAELPRTRHGGNSGTQ